MPGIVFCMKSHKKITVEQKRNLYPWDSLASILLQQHHAGSRLGFQHDDNCCTVQHICLNQTALGSTAKYNEYNIQYLKKWLIDYFFIQLSITFTFFVYNNNCTSSWNLRQNPGLFAIWAEIWHTEVWERLHFLKKKQKTS